MIIIIGGGIAGLAAARELRDAGRIVILEQADRPGGRVRTARDRDGRLLYEAGPWRVLDTHRRMIRLVYRMGCHLDPVGPRQQRDDNLRTKDVTARGVSVWASWIMRGMSVVDAFRRDLLTGYLGSSD